MPKYISMRWRYLWLAALCALPGCTSMREWNWPILAPGGADAQVVGRVSARGSDSVLGRAVVFLEPLDGKRPAANPPAVVIRQRRGSFEPEFAVVSVGQPVRFSNRDTIFHGVFSYSRPNQFEERPFSPGQTRTVLFHHAGIVQIYSPIDASMQGLIVVVPDRHHAIPDAGGDFRIPGVPAGRYRLSLWAEAQGATTREIALSKGEVERVELTLGRAVKRPPDV